MRRCCAPAIAIAAAALLAGADREQRRAERRDAVLHRLLRARAERDDRDHRADADHDAEHREQRAELVGPKRAERDAYDFANEHLINRPGRRDRRRPATRTAPGRLGHPGVWPPSGSAFGASAILLLETLRLQRERAEHHDPFAFLQAVHDFGVIEIALAELHDARMELRLRAVADEDETLTLARRAVRAFVLDGVSELPAGRPPDADRGVPPAGAPCAATRARPGRAGVDADFS